MPPGIDGIEAAKQIRAVDPNINIVVVTGSVSPLPENLEKQVPPAEMQLYEAQMKSWSSVLKSVLLRYRNSPILISKPDCQINCCCSKN